MAKQPESEEVPEGAAVVPLIPENAGVSPLFLALFHALVFLEGSSEEVIDPVAADEAVEFLATYLQRLAGEDLENVRIDQKRLTEYARRNQWSKDQLDFIQNFARQFGIPEVKS
jgi:hypothetical protein